MCNRWNRNHTDDLQNSYFNGVGFESWENIWGIYNPITPRIGEAIRRTSTILRYFSNSNILTSEDWVPHTLETKQEYVYASRFTDTENDDTIWLLVNRNMNNADGIQLVVDKKVDFGDDVVFYDVYHGMPLNFTTLSSRALSFNIEGLGYGAVFKTTKSRVDAKFTKFLQKMKELTKLELSTFPAYWNGIKGWQILEQRMIQEPKVVYDPNKIKGSSKMVLIPRKNNYNFKVKTVAIEGNDWGGPGGDVQYPWEHNEPGKRNTFPNRIHDSNISINAFYIDEYPVTNHDYTQFVKEANYIPSDTTNFLKHLSPAVFSSSSSSMTTVSKQPVRYVGIEDSRAYCKWAGKRLLNEVEWVYSADGGDSRKYPWGDEWDSSAVPKVDNGRDPTTKIGTRMREPDLVNAHDDKGASPFGVKDLVGNLHEWTNEFVDDRTRRAVVRGGSYYQPLGDTTGTFPCNMENDRCWYFPTAMELDVHNTYLLMSPSLDRSGGVGFRCAADVA